MSVFTKRLKEARKLAGLSQEALGVAAGLEEESASTRMNRYEVGARVPDHDLVERFAAVLNVPAPFFYTSDDEVAWLLVTYHRMRPVERKKVIEAVRGMVS